MNLKPTKLRKMLDDHKKWLKNETGGKKLDMSNIDLNGVNLRGEDLRDADLNKVDLKGADLSYSNLSGARLRYANLSYANLRYANLSHVNLIHADLSYVDLRYTDLRYVNLKYADLSDANLSYANLIYADLYGTNLRDANLRDANLRHANLSYADLFDADLRSANLFEAILENAELKVVNVNSNTAYYHLRCPEEGSYIGFKKVQGNLIVKLEIPADAARSSATTNKCRASKAKVLEISDIERKHFFGEARSNYDSEFVYRVGEMVEVSDFNNNRWEECASGIHHFMTREEAIVY